MTRMIAIASAATSLADSLRNLGRVIASAAGHGPGTAAAGEVSPRLAHDAGISDLRPARDEGEARGAQSLAREMMRRSF